MIIKCEEKNLVQLKTFYKGEPFRFEHKVYIFCGYIDVNPDKRVFKSVELSSGNIINFSENTQVEPINAEVIVYD